MSTVVVSPLGLYGDSIEGCPCESNSFAVGMYQLNEGAGKRMGRIDMMEVIM
jgi:hypothetical protein